LERRKEDMNYYKDLDDSDYAYYAKLEKEEKQFMDVMDKAWHDFNAFGWHKLNVGVLGKQNNHYIIKYRDGSIYELQDKEDIYICVYNDFPEIAKFKNDKVKKTHVYSEFLDDWIEEYEELFYELEDAFIGDECCREYDYILQKNLERVNDKEIEIE